MTVSKERKAELIAEFGKDEHDSGSAPVQVALLSERIGALTEHMKSHTKDYHTSRPAHARWSAPPSAWLHQEE